jgi:hypothetical protein
MSRSDHLPRQLYANFCRRMGAMDAPPWERLGAGFLKQFHEDAATLTPILRDVLDALEGYDTPTAMRILRENISR